MVLEKNVRGNQIKTNHQIPKFNNNLKSGKISLIKGYFIKTIKRRPSEAF